MNGPFWKNQNSKCCPDVGSIPAKSIHILHQESSILQIVQKPKCSIDCTPDFKVCNVNTLSCFAQPQGYLNSDLKLSSQFGDHGAALQLSNLKNYPITVFSFGRITINNRCSTSPSPSTSPSTYRHLGTKLWSTICRQKIVHFLFYEIESYFVWRRRRRRQRRWRRKRSGSIKSASLSHPNFSISSTSSSSSIIRRQLLLCSLATLSQT